MFYQELLSSTKIEFCLYISWNADNWIETYIKIYCYCIFKKVKWIILKFRQFFAKTLPLYILEIKTIFVNADEHEY